MIGEFICVTRIDMTSARPLIAVVDDEEPVRRAIARLIRSESFEVDSFASGEEFLESLQRRCPDCVVLDVHMPGLSGRDVQRHLLQAHIRVPLIVVTAQDAPVLRQQCLADGALGYLPKTEVAEHLMRLIREAIESQVAAPKGSTGL
jgi:FixJ family two-component response regulator